MANRSLRELWQAEHAARSMLYDRVQKYAAMTIPAVCPPQGTTQQDPLAESYQSLGAQGAANLRSSVLTALFPAGIPWYRLELTETARRIVTARAASTPDPQGAQQKLLMAAEVTLANSEQAILRSLDASNFRVKAGFAIEQAIITGSFLVRINPDYSVTSWKFPAYTVRRDGSGKVLQILIQEKLDPLAMDRAFLAKVQDGTPDRTQVAADADPSFAQCYDLYTRVRWEVDSKRWTMVQECNGKTVNEAEYTVSPYIAGRWTPEDGENYGRGLIEEKRGDLRSFDGLNKAILEAAAGASKMLMLVNPAGVTKPKQLSEAKNLAVLYGRAEDVSFLRTDKAADLMFALQSAKAIEDRLGQGMLLFMAARRTGERVTATEVQQTIAELDGALGGAYSNLTLEFQRPLITRWVYQMQRDGQLPQIPEGLVNTAILTGIEALSREAELSKLLQTLQVLAPLPGLAQRLDPMGIARWVFMQRGLDPTGFIKSDQQVAAEQAAAMQQQAAQAAAAKAIDTAGNVAGQVAQQQLAPPQESGYGNPNAAAAGQ